MAIPDLDPRNGGTCVNILAKKFTCLVIAIIQMVFWAMGLFTLIFKPSYAGAIVQNVDTKEQVIICLILIACLAFSGLLVAGVIKERRLFVKIYLVYVMVLIVLLILSLIINIFTQPQRLGFRGFFTTVLDILLNILCFFIVRCYYLMEYCRAAPRTSDFNKV